MKIVIILAILSALFSCASRKRSQGKDIDDITELDFVSEEMVRYKKNKDYYNVFDFKQSENNSLGEETIQGNANLHTKKLKNSGNQIDDLLYLASLCYESKFKDAFFHADNIYRRYQKHPGYWNQLGNCYLLKNELRKAHLFYKQSLKYDKNYAPAYNNIGNIHIRYGEYSQALAAYKKANKLKKNALTPAYNLAQLYLNFGAVGKAQKLLNFINKQRPGDFKIISSLASTYLFQGNTKKSLLYFKKIPSDKVENPSIGLNYAVALAVSGNKKMAKRVFGSIDNNQPEWKEYYLRVKRFVRR